MIYKLFRTLYMSCNEISQKPIKHWPLNIFYLLITYLFTKIESGWPGSSNQVPASKTGSYRSNHYLADADNAPAQRARETMQLL